MRRTPPPVPVGVRLLRRMQVDPASGCWRFTGAHIAEGYAMIWAWDRMRLVHRVAHELLIGPVPDDWHVDHVAARGCIHRDCFNPDHLEAVTPRVNAERSDNPVAVVLRTGRCRNGHEMPPWEGVKRQCKQCASEWAADRYARGLTTKQRRAAEATA
jgi:hypothetical protein